MELVCAGLELAASVTLISMRYCWSFYCGVNVELGLSWLAFFVNIVQLWYVMLSLTEEAPFDKPVVEDIA